MKFENLVRIAQVSILRCERKIACNACRVRYAPEGLRVPFTLRTRTEGLRPRTGGLAPVPFTLRTGGLAPVPFTLRTGGLAPVPFTLRTGGLARAVHATGGLAPVPFTGVGGI